MANLTAVLGAAGAAWSHVVKADIFLVDLADFAAVNEVYARFFGEPLPARGVIEVAALPKGALIAIEAVAYVA